MAQTVDALSFGPAEQTSTQRPEDVALFDLAARSQTTSQPAQQTPIPLEQQIRQQWGGYANWDVAGVNRAKELADLLSLQGVTSLGDVRLIRNDPVLSHYNLVGAGEGSEGWQEPVYSSRDQFKIGDKTLGFLGDYNLDDTYGSKAGEYLQGDNRVGWSARGEGNVSYNLQQDPRTGEYFIAPSWGSSSDKEDILKIAQLGLMFVPGIGQTLGAALGASGTAATMLGNALVSGTMSELGGGDFLKGAVTGGIGAGLGSFASPYLGEFASSVGEALGGGPLGDIAGRAVSGAGSSALNAIVRGQDLEDAFLSGLVGGGAGGVSSALTGLVDLPAPIERIIERGLTSGMLGQDTEAALVNALIGEAGRGITQGGQQGAGNAPQQSFTGGTESATSSGDFDWASLYNTPSELPGYTDPDGFYVPPTDVTSVDQSTFPVQDFGTSPQSDINTVYDRIENQMGGFASTWQTVGSDRVMVQDDGSAIGVNTETGETYSLTPEETAQMVDLGLLNTATSGYQNAIQGPGATTPRTTTPVRGTTPTRGTTASAGQGSDDLLALLALMTAMGGREEAPEQYQLANVAPGVQAGLRTIEEMYGTNRG